MPSSSSSSSSSLRYEYSTADSYYVLLTVLLLVVPPLSYLVLSGRMEGLCALLGLCGAESPRRKLPPRCPGAACSHVAGSAPKPPAAHSAANFAINAEINNATATTPTTTKKGLMHGLMYASWAALAFCIIMIMTSTSVVQIWDPYKALNLTSSASTAEVRKAYRRLTLTHHPDKVAPAKRAAAEIAFHTINKAYRVLTETKAKENWERYGNPDGPGVVTFGIALPPWLLNPRIAVALYLSMIFIVARGVLRMWRASTRHFSSFAAGDSGRMSRAAEAEGIGHIEVPLSVADAITALPANSLTFQSLLILIARAIDAATPQPAAGPTEEEWGALRAPLAAYFSNKSGAAAAAAASPSLALLFGHMTRRLSEPRNELVRVAAASASFAFDCAMRNMSSRDALVCIDVRRAISAAKLPSHSILLQIPYVMPEHVEMRRGAGAGGSAANASANMIGLPVGDIASQLEAALSRHIEFGERFTDAEIGEMKDTAHAIPRLTIESVDVVDAKYADAVAAALAAGSEPADVVAAAAAPMGLDLQSTRARARVHVSLASEAREFVCAPRFPDAQRNGLWVLVISSQTMLLAATFVPFVDGQLDFYAELEFGLPVPLAGSFATSIVVASPYFVVNAERRIVTKVTKTTNQARKAPHGARGAADDNDDLIANFG